MPVYEVRKDEIKNPNPGITVRCLTLWIFSPYIMAELKPFDSILYQGNRYWALEISPIKMLDQSIGISAADWIPYIEVNFERGAEQNTAFSFVQKDLVPNKSSVKAPFNLDKWIEPVDPMRPNIPNLPVPSDMLDTGAGFAVNAAKTEIVFYEMMTPLDPNILPEQVERVWANGRLIFNRALLDEANASNRASAITQRPNSRGPTGPLKDDAVKPVKREPVEIAGSGVQKRRKISIRDDE